MLGVDRSYALLTPEDAQAHVAHGIMVLDQCLYDGRNQPGDRVVNLPALAMEGSCGDR